MLCYRMCKLCHAIYHLTLISYFLAPTPPHPAQTNRWILFPILLFFKIDPLKSHVQISFVLFFMIKRYQFFNLNELPSKLSSLIKNSRENSVSASISNALQPDIIIVPSMDYANWLTVQLAGLNEQQIAANISFHQPEGFIKEFNEGLDNSPASNKWSKTAIQFALFKYVPEWLRTGKLDGYEALDMYQNLDAFKQFRIAGYLADAFDLYLVFRPRWMKQWRTAPLSSGDPNKRWQSQVWYLLTQQYPTITDRSLDWHVDNKGWQDQCSYWPNHIFCIALATLSKSSIEWFGRFQQTEHTTLHLLEWRCQSDYVRQQHLFEESESSGDSARSLAETSQYWNKQRTDLRKMYTDLWKTKIKIGDSPIDGTQADTFLHQLQTGLRSPKSAKSLKKMQPDGSLQVHMAHSPTREAEVLHERLLDCFEQHSALRPDDVLVVTPDVQTYGPVLRGVFENPEDEALALPIHLNDPNRQPLNKLTELLVRILETAAGRYKVTEILDLISHPNIRRTFQIDLEDLDTIEHWLIDLNTRWGYDLEHKQQILNGSQSDTQDNDSASAFSEQNSWMQSLDRLWMGLSTRGQTDTFPLDILPYDGVEGSRHQRLLGTLHLFMHKLRKLDTFLKQSHSTEVWLNKLMEIVREWISVDDNHKGHKHRLIEQITTLADDLSPVGGKELNCSLNVILDTIDRYLLRSRLGVVRVSGRVVISSMVPTRSIPYKIIAIVGLNEGQFPGKESSNPFDLIQSNPLPGDRSRKTEDRQLFFDYLMAAQQRIIITCTGMSERTDEEIPPSPLVSELLSLIEIVTRTDENRWIQRHPLHDFRENTPTYFESREGMVASSQKARNEEFLFPSLARLDTPILWDEWFVDQAKSETLDIALDDIIRFYQNPIKFYCQHHLGLRLREQEYADNDIEPFQLNTLDKYKAYNNILIKLLTEPDYEPEKQTLLQEGVMPHGRTGHQLWTKTVNTLKQQRQQLLEHIASDHLNEPKTVEMNLQVEDMRIRLKGKSALLFNGHQLLVKTGGSSKAKDLLKARLSHLLLVASGEPITTQLWAGLDTLKRDLLMETPMNSEILDINPVIDALEELTMLIKGFLIGHNQPLAFLPESTLTYSTMFYEKEKKKKKTPAEMLNKARLKFHDPNSRETYLNENNDPWYQYVFRSLNPYDEDESAQKLIHSARQIWEPILVAKNR